MAEIVNGFKRSNLIDYYITKGLQNVALLAFCPTFNEGTFFQMMRYLVTEEKDLRIACDELKLSGCQYDFKMI